jgi:hypothetical protein
MTSRHQNQLNMIGTCITVAQSPEHKSAWEGQEPADFGTDLAKLSTDYTALSLKAAQAEAATGGAADEKAVAEAALENLAYIAARALVNHFKKTGDRDRLGKVDSCSGKNPFTDYRLTDERCLRLHRLSAKA